MGGGGRRGSWGRGGAEAGEEAAPEEEGACGGAGAGWRGKGSGSGSVG